MKQLLLLAIASFFITLGIQAQVGIGTTTPDASSVLDIHATDKGVLIPRVSLADVSDTMLDGTNTAATGLLIYNTNAATTGGTGEGYYYFNGSVWEQLATSNSTGDHDFYEEGTTTAPDDINDDQFTMGNLAIGKNVADYSLDIDSNSSRGISLNVNTSNSNTFYGTYSTLTGNGTGAFYGNYNSINHTGGGSNPQFGNNNYINTNTTGTVRGTFNQIISNGNNSGLRYGTHQSLTGTGLGPQVGSYSAINNQNDGFHAGFYSIIASSGDGIHYGNRNQLQSGGQGIQYGVFNEITNFGDNSQYGVYSTIANNGDGNHYGSYNNFSGYGLGTKYGVYNNLASIGESYGVYSVFNSDAGSNRYGVSNEMSGTGDGDQFGVNTLINNSGNGAHYGMYNTLSGSGHGVQFGSINKITNSGLGTHYGSYNDLTGNHANLIYGTYNNVNTGGNGDYFGVYNKILNSGNGDHVGTQTLLNGQGSGSKTGFYSILSGSGAGTQFAMSALITNSGNGPHYGVYNGLTGSGNGPHYGVNNQLSGSGTGPKYGIYSRIINTAGGTHFGVHSEVLKVGSYAGYFLGNVSIGTTTGNNYILPSSRGVNGQVMQTDGVGNVSWVNDPSPSYWSRSGGVLNLATATDDITFTSDQTSIGFPASGGAPAPMIYMFSGGTSNANKMVLSHSPTYSSYGLSYNDADDSFQFLSAGTNVLEVDLTGSPILTVNGVTQSDEIAVGITVPTHDITIKQSGSSQAGSGGLGLISPYNTDNWKVYHSGSHLSFAENGARRAYIETATGNYVIASDKRLKKNFELQADVLNEVNKLKIYNYHYQDQSFSDAKSLGFLAQEVQKVFPDAVKQNEEGYLGINYDYFSVVAIKAIKEQQKTIENQKSEIELLKKDVAAIKTLLKKQ